MVLHIKHMVSNRCINTVRIEMEKIGLSYKKIQLGEVEMFKNPTPRQCDQLRLGLLASGLELIEDKTSILIERIKNIITDMVHYTSEIPRIKTSNYICERINYDYTYLANIFSKGTGMTIEHFIISHKIERAKELIVDNDLTLTEISFLLNYSSVAHLSRQFKQVTGLTVSCFKKAPTKHRIPLENINDWNTKIN